MALRYYQIDQVKQLRESFSRGHKRIILAAPTGSGKSLVMAEMTRLSYEKGRRVVLLTHRMELFRATLAHIGRAGIPCVEISAKSAMPKGDWKVMLAMEKTLWNRINKHTGAFLPPDLIIADEIHFQNFSKIIDHFSEAFLIGFSATPIGKHIPKIYGDIISNIEIPELIEKGYLARCKPYQMEDNFDDVKISKGEFEDKSLFRHFNKSSLYEGIIDQYRTHALGMKTIIFCCNVEHTEKTWQTFKDEGYTAYMVHSKMSYLSRLWNTKEFEEDPSGIMINCGILTTGYDCPSIKCVIVYRATTSLPLWLQMQGRASRSYPGKDYFIVLDFGQNHNRHGLWNQPRTWTLDPPKKRLKVEAAPVKNCPQCSAMVYATAKVCEFCEYVFPVPTYELKEGVMVEVGTSTPLGLSGKRISELSLPDLINLQKTKKMKSSYIWRVIRTREAGDKEKEIASDPCLSEYANLMGYKPGWSMAQRKKIEEGMTGFTNYVIK